MARSCFLDARPVSVESDHVVIGFDAEFEENLVNARTPRIEQTVQRIISKVLGRTVSVEYRLLESGEQESGPAPGVPAGDGAASAVDPTEEVADAGAETIPSGADDQTLLKDPAVKNVLEAFEGRVVEIRR